MKEEPLEAPGTSGGQSAKGLDVESAEGTPSTGTEGQSAEKVTEELNTEEVIEKPNAEGDATLGLATVAGEQEGEAERQGEEETADHKPAEMSDAAAAGGMEVGDATAVGGMEVDSDELTAAQSAAVWPSEVMSKPSLLMLPGSPAQGLATVVETGVASGEAPDQDGMNQHAQHDGEAALHDEEAALQEGAMQGTPATLSWKVKPSPRLSTTPRVGLQHIS